jgi:hypothetical protein
MRAPVVNTLVGSFAFLLLFQAHPALSAQGPPSPQTITAERLLQIARSDGYLVVRVKAVDVLGKLVDPTDKELMNLLLLGLTDLFNNYPQVTDKIYPDRVFFRVHVAQALGNLGPFGKDALPDLVLGKGQDPLLDREVDDAINAILAASKPPPVKILIDPSATKVTFTDQPVVSGSTATLTITVVATDTKPISGLPSEAFAFKPSADKKTGTFGPVTETATKGTYTTDFKGATADVDTWTILVAGVPLSTKPKITVSAGPISTTTSSAVFDKGTAASGGPSVTLTIVLMDAANNPVTGLDGSKFDVSLKPGMNASKGTFDKVSESKKPGTYTANFTGTTAGLPTDCVIKINNSIILSPPKIIVTNGPISADSVVKFDNNTVKSGSIVTLSISLKDAKGNVVTGVAREKFKFDVAGTSTGKFGDVTEPIAESGTYAAGFQGTTAGAASTVTITVDGVALTTKPAITVTPGPVSNTSTATFAKDNVAVGGTVTLTLVVKDAAGNAITGLDGKAFKLALTGGKSAGTFGAVAESTTKGTYTATFTGATAGTASTLTAVINGVSITTKAKIQVK